jgi:hypothetical protein
VPQLGGIPFSGNPPKELASGKEIDWIFYEKTDLT